MKHNILLAFVFDLRVQFHRVMFTLSILTGEFCSSVSFVVNVLQRKRVTLSNLSVKVTRVFILTCLINSCSLQCFKGLLHSVVFAP